MLYGLVAGIVLMTWAHIRCETWATVRQVTVRNFYLKIWIPCAVIACIAALLYWLDLWAFCAVIVFAEIVDKDAFVCREVEESAEIEVVEAEEQVEKVEH
jgi:hypothetical protein